MSGAVYEQDSIYGVHVIASNRHFWLGSPSNKRKSNCSTEIDLISPTRGTYNTNHVELIFTPSSSAHFLNITFTSYSYSLDGNPEIPLSGNTTINGLSPGTHTMVIYGHTGEGTGRSQKVHFDIYISTAWIIAIPTILASALSAGIAVAYKKRRSKRVK
jgi:hypothetical protein